MNGARSNFMRKGYLLTALAAAVLLAASSGTALAQVTVTGPAMNTVNEGDTVTLNVSVKGYIPAAPNADNAHPADEASLTVGVPTGAAGVAPVTQGEIDTANAGSDISANQRKLSVTFNIPMNATTSRVAFSATGTLSVVTTHDNDAEDEFFNWGNYTFEAGGLTSDDPAEGTQATPLAQGTGDDAPPTSFTIDDDETQTYALAVSPASQKPTEGTGVTVSLSAMPAHVQGSASLTVNIDKPAPAYLLSGPNLANNQVTIGQGGQVSETLTVTQADPDGNRESDTVTLTVYSGQAGGGVLEASLPITIADLHALPAVTAMVVDEDGDALDPQPEYVAEGESVMLKVMVVNDEGKPSTAIEDLKVELSPSGSADARDYRLSTQTLEIASGMGESGAVTLMAEMDEDVGMESLVLSATVSGEMANGTETSTSEGVLSLGIMDNTEKKIEPKATDADYQGIMDAIAAGAGDEGLNPGETVTLMTSDLFDVMEGYTASYGVSVEGDSVSASASGEMVTIDAMMAGESKITVTGTASMASSSLKPSQTTSNVASLTFPVMVVDKALVVTLEMPGNVMEGNIVEGMSYEIGVMANRMVTEAEGSVEVMIMRDRAESDADDSDFTVSSATIMAGYDSATAELMVTEDNMPDGGTDDNMGEQLVLYGMAGDMETNALTFTIWDQAVPTLPLIGQLLLALFLMAGGARLYRRRQG